MELYKKIEQHLCRPLNTREYEMIENWIRIGYTDDFIITCLVYSEDYMVFKSLAYVDKVCFNFWKWYLCYKAVMNPKVEEAKQETEKVEEDTRTPEEKEQDEFLDMMDNALEDDLGEDDNDDNWK